MRKQLGFLNIYLIGAVVVGMLTLGLVIQTKRLESEKAEHAAFIAAVRVEGEVAQRVAKATHDRNLKRKEVADRENLSNRTRIADLSRRLRDERTRGSYLPAAAPGAVRPDRIAFDRAKLDGALRQLDEVVSGLIEEGDRARIDLDTARGWAKGQ